MSGAATGGTSFCSSAVGRIALVATAICAATASLPSLADDPIVVGEGTTLSIGSSYLPCFKHYRFKIDACMGPIECVQFSEFRLLNGDTDVTRRTGFTFGTGMDANASESPTQVLDGNLNTKLCSSAFKGGENMTNCWLQINYEEPQQITAYDWATAGDRWFTQNSSDKRDPMTFRLLGSDDGETWMELDSRTIKAEDLTRKAWTGPYPALKNIGDVSVEGGTLEAQVDFAISNLTFASGTVSVPAGCLVRVATVGSAASSQGTLEVDGELQFGGKISVGTLAGRGVIRGNSGSGDRVVVGAEASGSTTYFGHILWKDGVTFVKAGSGAMAFSGYTTHDVPLVVQDGTLSLAAETPAFKHYRFKIDGGMGYGMEGIQFTEFRLLNGDTDVTGTRSGFTWPEGMTAHASHPLAYALDADLSTKFLSLSFANSTNMMNCWLQVDYANSQPITAYDWATADDRSYGTNPGNTREPKKFRLLGSNDGETWTELDSQDIGNVALTRKSWTGPYVIDGRYGQTTVVGGQVEVMKDATFAGIAQRQGGGVSVGEGCTLTLADGGVWHEANAAAGSAGEISVSAGTAYVADGGALSSGISVVSNTFAFAAGGTSDRFFRITFKKVAGDDEDCLQLSRMAVYDAVGNELSKGLTAADAGTAPSALSPGTCAYGDASYTQGGDSNVEYLFDGKTGTKMCLTGLPKNTEFVRVVNFRLPEAQTAAAYSYMFTTANDRYDNNKNCRTPTLWTFESSPDGVTWQIVDTRTADEFTIPYAQYTDLNGGTQMVFRAVTSNITFSAGVVSVAADATLDFGDVKGEVSGLRIDCATGIGTISRFAPAASGTLALENVPAGTRLSNYSIAFAPTTVVDADNLRKWKVTANGVSSNYKAQLSDGKITFVPNGFVIIVR